MNKKLIGLLPLVWLGVLSHYHVFGGGHKVNTPDLSNNVVYPMVLNQFGVFDPVHPKNMPIFMRMGNRSVRSVTASGCPYPYPRPLQSQPVQFTTKVQTVGFPCTQVVLSAKSLSRLQPGMQQLRINMSDMSMTQYTLIVQPPPPPTAARVNGTGKTVKVAKVGSQTSEVL